MNYENYLKENLVKECYRKDKIIEEQIKKIEELEDNEQINKKALIDRMYFEEQLKQKEGLIELDNRVIENLKEQLEIYKECIKAISRNKSE